MQDRLSSKRFFSKRISWIVGTAFLIPAIALLLVNGCVKSSTKDRILSPAEAGKFRTDCILVLGAGVRSGGIPSPMLQDRLLQGIELYQAGISDRLLMSGDHGQKSYDEVNVMKRFAVSRGIPSQDVFMDHAGFSTYESLYRSKAIFQAERIIIVSQRYHLYRALYIANALGLEAWGVPSDPREYSGQAYREFREIMGRFKDFLVTIVQPSPTYLGDPIPLSGDGDITNDQTS